MTLTPVLAHGLGGIAGIAGDLVLDHLGGPHVLPELGLIGQRFRLRPGGLDGGRAADCVPFVGRDDTEEIALAYHLDDAGNALEGAVIHAFELGADRGGTHHAAVQHAGHLEVLHVGEAAGDLCGDVDPRLRLADDLVVLRRLFLHRLFGIERDRKALAADQLAVAHVLAAARNHAVCDGELVGAELLCRFRHQCLARGGRCLTQLHAAKLDGEAAPGVALVGREQGVALDQLDAADWHVELLRHDLAQRRGDAGAEIDLAGIDGDVAGLVDGEEGIDFGERHRLGAGLRHRFRQRAGRARS